MGATQLADALGGMSRGTAVRFIVASFVHRRHFDVDPDG